MSEEKRKLLIVEDDEGLQRQLKWCFDEYEVLMAASRAEAVTLARRFEPAVVLQDLGLPPDAAGVTEGMQTLREELEQPGTLPATPPGVGPGMPVELLRRRPDVRRAERQLAAATARGGRTISRADPSARHSGVPRTSGHRERRRSHGRALTRGSRSHERSSPPAPRP